MAALPSYILIGTRAAQPAASTLSPGTLYCVSDENNLIERNSGSAWVQWGPSPGSLLGAFSLLDLSSVAYVAGQTAGATYGVVGIGDAGSISTAGTLSKVATSANMFCDFATSAVASATSSWRSVFTLLQRQHNIDLQMVVRAPSTLTSIRLWLGLFSSSVTDSDTAPGHAMAFRFSSVAGDTGWRPITRDGTTQNVGSNIGTVVADTAYRLRIRCSGTHVYFSVNGGTEQDVTSNLPTSTQDLGPQQIVIAQANSSRNFGMSRTLIKYGTAV